MELRELLLGIMADLEISKNGSGHYSHADLGVLGAKLGKAAGRKKPYPPQYLVNVTNNNYGVGYNSKKLRAALEFIAAGIDGRNKLSVSHTESVVVYAEPENVKEGSIVYGSSRVCANPTCKVSFVPRIYNQAACSPDCSKELRKIKRKAK